MNELLEYREQLLARLERTAPEFRSACLEVREPHEPLEPGGWSVHQVAVHARDVDKLVYGARARRTLAEVDPQFPNFDGEAYMTQHYDPQEALPALLDGLVASTQALTKILREMPLEGWSRTSRHATRGAGFTLQTWVEEGLAHLQEHLATVRDAVRSK